ncbi:MAG: aldo/keto reductase [Chloroflexota bacterium]|nr:aldo/keto reductase [Chloroflexota bacterium]
MSLPDMPLGPTDLLVRPLGVGTMRWGEEPDESAEPTDPAATFEAAIAAGVSVFDTAEGYLRGDSERELGRVRATSAAPAFVATKFAPLRLTSAALPRALDASLRRLQLESVDLYQIHFPFGILRIRSLMNRLADAVEAGRVRNVGVCNYSAAQMRTAHAALAARGVPLVSNQVHYNLLHRDPERNGVLDACRELNVTLIAYLPLASGMLTGKYRGGDTPSRHWIRRRTAPFPAPERMEPLLQALDEVGKAHERTAAQVALNWLARQDNVLPIPGARHARQARENAGAIDFAMSDAEAARLSALSDGLS